MRDQHKVSATDDVAFTRPLAIPGSKGAIIVRSVNQAIDWIEGRGRHRIHARTRDIAWRLHEARHTRSQAHADDASDRLVEALAAEGVLQR